VGWRTTAGGCHAESQRSSLGRRLVQAGASGAPGVMALGVSLGALKSALRGFVCSNRTRGRSARRPVLAAAPLQRQPVPKRHEVYLSRPAIMDFPDLGAAVGPPKRDKIPPRKKSSAAPERKPKSALQSLLEGKSGAMNGGAGAAGDYAVEKEAKGSAAPAEAVEVLAEIGPPPKPVAEPDAAAHEEATAAIQTRIDEGEKRVVRSLSYSLWGCRFSTNDMRCRSQSPCGFSCLCSCTHAFGRFANARSIRAVQWSICRRICRVRTFGSMLYCHETSQICPVCVSGRAWLTVSSCRRRLLRRSRSLRASAASTKRASRCSICTLRVCRTAIACA
jgi:hypothetical protein